jgi:hypothetical protein
MYPTRTSGSSDLRNRIGPVGLYDLILFWIEASPDRTRRRVPKPKRRSGAGAPALSADTEYLEESHVHRPTLAYGPAASGRGKQKTVEIRTGDILLGRPRRANLELYGQSRWEAYGAGLGIPGTILSGPAVEALWGVGGVKKVQVAGFPSPFDGAPQHGSFSSRSVHKLIKIGSNWSRKWTGFNWVHHPLPHLG